MSYAVIWDFDPVFSATVRGIWQRLADIGLNNSQLELGAPPHVTLTAGDDLNPDLYRAELESFSQKCPAFTLHFGHWGIFPGETYVLYLGIELTRPVVTTHTQFFSNFRAYTETPNIRYTAGRWVPHVTLATGLSAADLTAALPIALDLPLPLEGHVTGVQLVSYPPAETLYHYPITGARE